MAAIPKRQYLMSLEILQIGPFKKLSLSSSAVGKRLWIRAESIATRGVYSSRRSGFVSDSPELAVLLADDAGSKLKMAAGRFIDKLRLKASRSVMLKQCPQRWFLLKKLLAYM